MNLLQRGLHLRHRYPIETSVVPESSERLGYLLAKDYFPIRLSVDIRPATVDDRTHSQINFMYSSIQFNHFTHHTYKIYIALSQQKWNFFRDSIMWLYRNEDIELINIDSLKSKVDLI